MTPPLKLDPSRVFAPPDLNGANAVDVRLSPDGERVAFLRPALDDTSVLDLWIAPVSGGGAPRILVAGADIDDLSQPLPDAERSRRERQRISQRGVVAYAWDDLGTSIMVPTGQEVRLIDPTSGRMKTAIALLSENGPSTDARLSPKGRWLSFLKDGELWVTSLAEGAPRRLSPAARGDVRYGAAEFVATEEFARDTGYWWNPDEGSVAFARVDEGPVETARWAEVDEAGARMVTQRFPRAGTANAVVDLFVARIEGGAAVRIDLGPEADVYLARVNWSADGRTLYIQRQSRDQRTLDLLAADPNTGNSRLVLRETISPWVSLTLDFHPLADGGFLWLSERTGFRHLYLYDAHGGLVRVVTGGNFPIRALDRARGVAGVDEDAGLAYVMASPDTALEQHLFVVNYRDGGPMRRVTGGEGWWTVAMDRRAKVFVGRFSNWRTPPRVAAYRADGTRLRWISENRLDESHPYHPYIAGLPKPEFRQLAAEDGQPLDCVLLRPAGFDPGRRYPAILQVYGGPGRQHVSKGWRAPTERMLLDAGFVVFQLDNRGAANRGLAFEAPIWKALGGPEVRDQLAGLAFLRSLPFIDPRRIGALGWSYGGYMTLRLLTEPEAGLAAGAAGAAATEWRLYDTHYTERFLGRPDAEQDAYEAASVLPRLSRLTGRLLLVHGMADDNVHLDHAVRAIAALQANGTVFDLMLYPGERHGVEGASARHLWRTYLDFFRRELGGPETGAIEKREAE